MFGRFNHELILGYNADWKVQPPATAMPMRTTRLIDIVVESGSRDPKTSSPKPMRQNANPNTNLKKLGTVICAASLDAD